MINWFAVRQGKRKDSDSDGRIASKRKDVHSKEVESHVELVGIAYKNIQCGRV